MLAISVLFRILQEMDFKFLKIWQAYLVPIRKDGKHIWSLTKLIWQACLVLFFINMASIPGPRHDQDGKHT